MGSSDYAKDSGSSLSKRRSRRSESSRERDAEKAERARRREEKRERKERKEKRRAKRDEEGKLRDSKRERSYPDESGEKPSDLEPGEIRPSAHKKERPDSPSKESKRDKDKGSRRYASDDERSESVLTTSASARSSRYTAEREESTQKKRDSDKERRARSRDRRADDSDEEYYHEKKRRRERREKEKERDSRERSRDRRSRERDEDKASRRDKEKDERRRDKDRERRHRDQDSADAQRGLRSRSRSKSRSRSRDYDKTRGKRRYASESPRPSRSKRQKTEWDSRRREPDRSTDFRATDYGRIERKRRYVSDSPPPISESAIQQHRRKRSRWDVRPEGTPSDGQSTETTRTTTPEWRPIVPQSERATECSPPLEVPGDTLPTHAGQISANDQIAHSAISEDTSAIPTQFLDITNTSTPAPPRFDPPTDMPKVQQERKLEMKRIVIQMPKLAGKKQLLPNAFANMVPRSVQKAASRESESPRTNTPEPSQAMVVDEETQRQELVANHSPPGSPRLELEYPHESDDVHQFHSSSPMLVEESPPPSPSPTFLEYPSTPRPIVYTLPATGEASQYAAEYAICGCAIEGVLQCIRCKLMRSSDRITNLIQRQNNKWAAEKAKALREEFIV